MSDEYKMISEFCCCGKSMVTVMIGNAAHVMSQEEWNKVYKKNYQSRWKTKVDRIGISFNKGCKQSQAS